MACYALQYLHFVGNAGGKEPLIVKIIIALNYTPMVNQFSTEIR
jgi:hypothetical protein